MHTHTDRYTADHVHVSTPLAYNLLIKGTTTQNKPKKEKPGQVGDVRGKEEGSIYATGVVLGREGMRRCRWIPVHVFNAPGEREREQEKMAD